MDDLKVLKRRFPGAQTFAIGDSASLNARLLELIRLGRKTASCGALRDFGPGKETLPVVGRIDIALSWDQSPALIIQTTEVTHCMFQDVPADFALAEGENETYAGWQRDHKAFFERNGGWSEDLMLVCERFVMIEDLTECQN